MTIKIQAKKRDPKKDKLAELRAKNFIPAVVYGPHTNSTLLYLDGGSVNLTKEAHKASVIPLVLEKEKKLRNVIIQDLQKDKITGKLLHVDLYEVDMNKEIETEIPLKFLGTSLAVKDLGGVLVKNSEEIRVKCLPASLPEQIEVDVSSLKTFEDMVHIRDLKIPSGVEILDSPDEVLLMVSKPRSEKEIEELDEEVSQDVSGVEGVEDKEEPEESEEEKDKEDEEKPLSEQGLQDKSGEDKDREEKKNTEETGGEREKPKEDRDKQKAK